MVSCHIAVQITCSLWLFCRLVAAFKAFPGIPRERIFNSNSTKELSASTQEECITRICPKDQLCSAVFSAKEQGCIELPELSPLVIFWGWKRILRPHKDFVTLVSTSRRWATMPPPVALWLLDHDYRGKNLGTGGSTMDIFVLEKPSRKPYSYEAQGPHSWDEDMVGYLQVFPKTEHTNFKAYFINIDGRIDFEKGFTISLWIKTEAEDGLILNNPAPAPGMDMWLNPGTGQVGISHTGSWEEDRYTSMTKKMNPKDIKEWRHIAASYEGGKGAHPSFYVNGRLMQLEHSSNAKMITPTLTIVVRSETKSQMRACQLIFDKPLSQKQIRHVMNLCP